MLLMQGISIHLHTFQMFFYSVRQCPAKISKITMITYIELSLAKELDVDQQKLAVSQTTVLQLKKDFAKTVAADNLSPS